MRAVSALLLVAMTSLPVSSVVCGLGCLTAAAPAAGHHQHAQAQGHEGHAQAQEPSAGVVWRPLSHVAGHECDHHPGALREATMPPPAKIAGAGLSIVVLALTTLADPDVPAVQGMVPGHGPPDPGATARRTPLVLRI